MLPVNDQVAGFCGIFTAAFIFYIFRVDGMDNTAWLIQTIICTFFQIFIPKIIKITVKPEIQLFTKLVAFSELDDPLI